MRKITQLLVLLFMAVFSVNGQVLDVVEKGYYFVYVNDTIVSQHVKSNKAVIKAIEQQIAYPEYEVYVTQPNLEPVVNREDLIDMLGVVEEIMSDTLDLGTTIVEPLPNNVIMESVELNGETYILTYRLSEGSEIPEGGYDYYLDGVDQNNHSSELVVEVGGLDIAVEHCFFVEARYTQFTPLVFPRSNEMCYPLREAVIEVVDEMVLDDFNGFDVIVSGKYIDTIAECKQEEIKEIPDIENVDGFFVRYKHPAYEGLVSKMKVENGVLKYY